MLVGNAFGFSIIALVHASFKTLLIIQSTCLAQAGSATYSGSGEPRVFMDCLSNIQNTGALLVLTKIKELERLVSCRSAQSAQVKTASGEEQVLLFG